MRAVLNNAEATVQIRAGHTDDEDSDFLALLLPFILFGAALTWLGIYAAYGGSLGGAGVCLGGSLDCVILAIWLCRIRLRRFCDCRVVDGYALMPGERCAVRR